MSPRRQAPGRGVNRKIGGDLQGEPILPLDAVSARACQGSDDATGVCEHALKETADSTEMAASERFRTFGVIERRRVRQVSGRRASGLWAVHKEDAGRGHDWRLYINAGGRS